MYNFKLVIHMKINLLVTSSEMTLILFWFSHIYSYVVHSFNLWYWRLIMLKEVIFVGAIISKNMNFVWPVRYSWVVGHVGAFRDRSGLEMMMRLHAPCCVSNIQNSRQLKTIRHFFNHLCHHISFKCRDLWKIWCKNTIISSILDL